MTLRDAPARHALLFELLRQENLAREVQDRFQPAEDDHARQTAFAKKAQASLNAA